MIVFGTVQELANRWLGSSVRFQSRGESQYLLEECLEALIIQIWGLRGTLQEIIFVVPERHCERISRHFMNLLI